MSMLCRFFLLTALLTVGSAHGAVITFNDYAGTAGVPTSGFINVDGFDFSANAVGAQVTSPSSLSGTSSGTKFLYTSGGQTITMVRATSFNLTSVTAGLQTAGLLKTLTVGAEVLDLSAAGTTGNTFTLVGAGFTNLTSITFFANDIALIDNIGWETFVPPPVAVPEPASVLLLGLGTCVMGARRLRRRNTVIA